METGQANSPVYASSLPFNALTALYATALAAQQEQRRPLRIQRHDTAQHDTAPHSSSAVQYSTAQHRTAQHSTAAAQLSSAQLSAAQRQHSTTRLRLPLRLRECLRPCLRESPFGPGVPYETSKFS
jgi:hypothetical protein